MRFWHAPVSFDIVVTGIGTTRHDPTGSQLRSNRLTSKWIEICLLPIPSSRLQLRQTVPDMGHFVRLRITLQAQSELQRLSVSHAKRELWDLLIHAPLGSTSG